MLDFEIWPFQNRHLEPKGPVEVDGKSDKMYTFRIYFALREKNVSITFFNFIEALHEFINCLQTKVFEPVYLLNDVVL